MPDDFKSRWRTAVDQSAERARQQFLTPGAGQAAVYLRKEAEARRFLALDAEVREAQEAGPSWPYLSAELHVTADTLAGVAATIVALADAWDQAAGAIEALRLPAKAAIDAATTDAEAQAAAQVAMRGWPLAG